MESENETIIRPEETITERVEGFGSKGDPFIKKDNFVIFFTMPDGTIPVVEVGTEVEILVTRVLEKFAFGHLRG